MIRGFSNYCGNINILLFGSHEAAISGLVEPGNDVTFNLNSSYLSSVNGSYFSDMFLVALCGLGHWKNDRLRIGIDPVTMSVIILNWCDFCGLIWRHHQLMIRQQLAASNLTFTEDDTSSSNYSNHFSYFNYFTPCFTTQYYFTLFILYISISSLVLL